jgi:hypothetical protein
MSSLRKTYLKDGTMISTIRRTGMALAMDGMLDMFTGRASDLMYETMVFEDPTQHMRDAECVRYATEEEALAGHLAMVEKWVAMRGSPALTEEEEYGEQEDGQAASLQ